MKISEIKKTPDLVNESDPLKFGKRNFWIQARDCAKIAGDIVKRRVWNEERF